jgi:hypothetical protein
LTNRNCSTIAGQADLFAFGLDRHGIFGEGPAQHLRQPGRERVEQLALRGIGAEDLAFTLTRQIGQAKADIGFRHRQPLDHIGDRLRLGPIGAQEFQPGGRGAEQIAQLDHGAAVQRSGFDRADGPARHGDLRRIIALGARGDRQPPHRTQARQRLAAKAEGVDIQQIRAVDLGGRVAAERQRQILGRHAATVVGDADQRLATVGIGDLDPAGACVQRVFHQFLDRRGWAFHHLARRDPVRGGIVQLPDDRARSAYLGGCCIHSTRDSTAKTQAKQIRRDLRARRP